MVKVDKILSMGIKTGISIVPYQLLFFVSFVVVAMTAIYYYVVAKPLDIKFTEGCNGFNITPEKQQECDDKEARELKEFEDNKKILYIVGPICTIVMAFCIFMIMKKLNLLADKLGK
jgi:hypothetical protein